VTACGSAAAADFDAENDIVVVSREDGSGTRSAFIELFGVEVKDGSGNKSDKTTKEAVIARQTDVMMTNIAGDLYAIGYISLGSLNETVQAVAIDGVAPSPEAVLDGSYKVTRPFYVATSKAAAPSALAADFLAFITSAEGQAVVAASYVAVDSNASTYSGSKPAGKIVVAGSSSVTPVMEKLKEAYLAINPGATIEVQQSDSSAGLASAIEGTCDIAMSSRDLKEAEAAALTPTQIAIDGIAVIVNNNNPMSSMTSEQVRTIFTGEATRWSGIAQ
jgi:phosphate transport system substrate-binding protein